MRVTIICLFVICVLGLTAVYAEEQAPVTGTLTASGKGMSVVHLTHGTLTITGKGKLWISENTKVTITGTEGKKTKQISPLAKMRKKRNSGGEEAAPPREGYLYTGFDGKVVVSGDDVVAMLDSDVTQTVSATGNGEALLLGKGTFSVSMKGTEKKNKGTWSPRPSIRNRTRPTPVQFGAK